MKTNKQFISTGKIFNTKEQQYKNYYINECKNLILNSLPIPFWQFKMQ